MRDITSMDTIKNRQTAYYNFQEVQLDLYNKSKNGKSFDSLYEIIVSKENILLAYRSIKANKGSKTKGNDKKTIKHLAKLNQEEFIEYFRKKLINYKPKSVRRVLIPKDNGKTRPLGIPSIDDRIIQQMFKQVLEPICEAKFFNHSYGFRPLRSAHHAISRVQTLGNINKLQYAVDIDIKGFFDNVNHSKLIKQIWNIGIRDKRVIAIISKMLKAPIKGEGIPSMGVPQGGILSPLLSNIVLNDLDKWVANQWETFETRHKYVGNDAKIANLKRASKLKEGYIVRYADDFKIMTRTYDMAKKWFIAVKEFLKVRLGLDISEEKSSIVNLKQKHSDFLSYRFRLFRKRGKWVIKTNIVDKKKKSIINKLRELSIKIQKHPNNETISRYNSTLLGIQNYFRHATHVNNDFIEIEHKLLRKQRTRFKRIAKYRRPMNLNKHSLYRRMYGKKRKTFIIRNMGYLFIIGKVKTVNSRNYSQSINPYNFTRKFKWDDEIKRMMERTSKHNSVEYMDNRLSKYSMQKGLCAITKIPLTAEYVHCHHKIPRSLGGTDKFDNLVIVHEMIHRLIHATSEETITKIVNYFNLNAKQIVAVNKLRLNCKLGKIKL